MVTGQGDRVLCVSLADGARLNPVPRIQEQGSVLKPRRYKYQRFRLRPLVDPKAKLSPCEGLAGLVLAFTKSSHHGVKRPVGLQVRVLLQTLKETGSDQETD